MTSQANQRGSILVVVLFLAGLLGVFAVVAATVQSAAVDSSRSFAEGLRAEEAMVAATEYIVGRAGATLNEAQGTAVIQLGKTRVTLTAKSEASRIDLNRAQPELIAGIFRQVGVSPENAVIYAARIADWRDDDNKVSPNGGAEREMYRAAGRIDGPRNGPFLHVAELSLVLGIPLRAAAAVAPYVTVASGRAEINPMFADPPVLMALPGASENKVRDFLQNRQRQGASFDALVRRLGTAPDLLTEEAGQTVRFEGLVQITANQERRFEVVVSARGGDAEPYRILSWDPNPPARIRVVLP
jgi:general secretion pathway protein K